MLITCPFFIWSCHTLSLTHFLIYASLRCFWTSIMKLLLQIFVSVSVDSLILNGSRMCLWQLCINHIDILSLILCLWDFVACLDSMLHVVIMHSTSLSLTWYWLNEFVRESSHLILLEIFPGLLCFNWFRVSRDTWLICYTSSMPSF